MKITVCIAHHNDTDFILNTLYCLKRLTKNSYQVIIRDNHSKKKNFLKLQKGIVDYRNVELYQAPLSARGLQGSMSHGTALNDLVKKIDTPYGAIFDGDCVFLIKDWDEILISKLNDKVKIIGTQASPGCPKPMDFPLMFAIFFETQTLKKLNIDFRPQDIAKAQDSGWELREKYLATGFQGELLMAKNTRSYKNGFFADLLGIDEYYLPGIDNIFACHFGRGATSGSAKYKKGTGFIYKIPFISRPLRKMRGRKEIKKWISVCHEIANKQI
ncbi:MAG: glycosyltransferase family A protein [Patescibacteria group bacterium]